MPGKYPIGRTVQINTVIGVTLIRAIVVEKPDQEEPRNDDWVWLLFPSGNVIPEHIDEIAQLVPELPEDPEDLMNVINETKPPGRAFILERLAHQIGDRDRAQGLYDAAHTACIKHQEIHETITELNEALSSTGQYLHTVEQLRRKLHDHHGVAYYGESSTIGLLTVQHIRDAVFSFSTAAALLVPGVKR